MLPVRSTYKSKIVNLGSKIYFYNYGYVSILRI